MANATEQLIASTFQSYRDSGVANLVFLNPPMRVAGAIRDMPCYIPIGKAPFDLAGMFYDKAGTVIGVEVKENRDHETSLPIVHPEKKGNGLHYHQLEALVEVHKAGGVALVVWSNAGEVATLGGEALTFIKVQYDASLQAERARKTVARGVRSIPWEMFAKTKYGKDAKPLWLPASPVARKKAS